MNKSNTSISNHSLPMDYRSSLGTFDIVLGMGYEINKFHFVAAIQQPLTQNHNQFVSNNYPINSKLSRLQSTNNFKRSGDILFRASYPIILNSKFSLTPSLLSIYHLTNDKYTDQLGFQQEIAGSKGLTLNSNLYLDYEINRKNQLQLNIGVPFIVRKSRPDGLTRSIIVNLEYRMKF